MSGEFEKRPQRCTPHTSVRLASGENETGWRQAETDWRRSGDALPLSDYCAWHSARRRPQNGVFWGEATINIKS